MKNLSVYSITEALPMQLWMCVGGIWRPVHAIDALASIKTK
jgi:hypothetical protein